MSSKATSDVDVVELTDQQGAELFDEITRREMDMTGEEFLKRWDAGEYDGVDYDTVPGLVEVWMYLPFVR